MSDGKLFVTDSRTSKTYEIPIERNAITAGSLKVIKGNAEGTNPADRVADGLRVSDPGLNHTSIGNTAITWIDGKKGKILFRGYTIEQLWHCTFEEIAYLMIWDKLPSAEETEKLKRDIVKEMRNVPQTVIDTITSFPRTSPPMPMVIAGLAAYLGANPHMIPVNQGGNIYRGNTKLVDESIIQTMARYAVLVGLAASHRANKPIRKANESWGFMQNLLFMMNHVEEATGAPNPEHVSILERFGALAVDHGPANSTLSLLVTASTLADPLSCMISALGAAYGPLHFGAPEIAHKTLARIGTKDNVPALIQNVKEGKQRLFGYGHGMYKTVDPRLALINGLLEELDTGGNKLLEVAAEVNRFATTDAYFLERNLNANADLSGVFLYIGLGFPSELIPNMMIAARMPGLMAHYREAMSEFLRLLVWWSVADVVYSGESEVDSSDADLHRADVCEADSEVVTKESLSFNNTKLIFMENLRYFRVAIDESFVAHVTINRPQKRNAFFAPMWEELRVVMNHLSCDSSVRVVIVDGAGNNFSSGMDFVDSDTNALLQNTQGRDPARQSAKLEDWIRNIQDCVRSIETCGKPTICVIHSYAFGMALDIVCATDVRICSEDAVFSVMEIDMGMVADLGSLQHLPKIVGNQGWVKEICLTGRSFGAQEALSQGFVNSVFATKTDAMQCAEQMAKTAASKSPVAARATMEVLTHARDHTVQDATERLEQILEAQLGALIKELSIHNDATFHFIDGICPSEAGPGVASIDKGPYYNFYSWPRTGQPHEDDEVEDAFELIRETIEEDGPFDGILGFSHGATLAYQFLADHARRHPHDYDGLFRCAIFICGMPPFRLIEDESSSEDEAAMEENIVPLRDEAILVPTEPSKVAEGKAAAIFEGDAEGISLPSLHIVGRKDVLYKWSLRLYNLCPEDNATLVIHEKGHEVPRDRKSVAALVDAVRKLGQKAAFG
ncbi:citrate synthase [Paraphaeosphaeria sporulosa]